MIRAIWLRLTRRADHVSADWLSHQDAKSSRVEFDGPRIQFPLNKLKNESAPKWNAARLRKRA